MSPTTSATLLERDLGAVRARVSYLDGCVTVGADPWIPCASLVAPDGVLADLLDEDRTQRWVQDLPVAASVFFQGQATRVLGVGVGLWLIAGTVPDVALDATAITLQFELPARLGFTRVARAGLLGAPAVDVELVDDAAVLEWFVDRAFTHHLDPLADAITARVPIGRRLLWGNAAAALANAGHSVEAASPPEQRAQIAAATDRFVAAMPHDLAGLGHRFTPTVGAGLGGGASSFWERDACCLWFREDPHGAVCDSCSLLTVDDRRARLTAAAAR